MVTIRSSFDGSDSSIHQAVPIIIIIINSFEGRRPVASYSVLESVLAFGGVFREMGAHGCLWSAKTLLSLGWNLRAFRFRSCINYLLFFSFYFVHSCKSDLSADYWAMEREEFYIYARHEEMCIARKQFEGRVWGYFCSWSWR